MAVSKWLKKALKFIQPKYQVLEIPVEKVKGTPRPNLIIRHVSDTNRALSRQLPSRFLIAMAFLDRLNPSFHFRGQKKESSDQE